MTIMRLSLIMDRIKSAPPSSPIVVFRCATADHLDAVFDTWTTRVVREQRPRDYIGTYHSDMAIAAVRKELEDELL